MHLRPLLRCFYILVDALLNDHFSQNHAAEGIRNTGRTGQNIFLVSSEPQHSAGSCLSSTACDKGA